MSVTTEKVQGFQDPKSYGENEDQLPYVDRVRVGNGSSHIFVSIQSWVQDRQKNVKE